MLTANAKPRENPVPKAKLRDVSHIKRAVLQIGSRRNKCL